MGIRERGLTEPAENEVERLAEVAHKAIHEQPEQNHAATLEDEEALLREVAELVDQGVLIRLDGDGR